MQLRILVYHDLNRFTQNTPLRIDIVNDALLNSGSFLNHGFFTAWMHAGIDALTAATCVANRAFAAAAKHASNACRSWSIVVVAVGRLAHAAPTSGIPIGTLQSPADAATNAIAVLLTVVNPGFTAFGKRLAQPQRSIVHSTIKIFMVMSRLAYEVGSTYCTPPRHRTSSHARCSR